MCTRVLESHDATGVGSVMLGLICSTLSIPRLYLALHVGYSQLGSAVGSMIVVMPSLDSENHTLRLLGLCQLTQQATFFAGIFIGFKLVRAQRILYDEARELRERLLRQVRKSPQESAGVRSPLDGGPLSHR